MVVLSIHVLKTIHENVSTNSCIKLFHMSAINKLYIKIVAFDEIYNYVVEKFLN
jgi:hypothetical protein